MKFSKRFMLIMVLLLSCSLLLTACLAGDEPSSSENNNNEGSNAPSGGDVDVFELEPYEISMVFPGSVQSDHDLVVAEMNKYLTEKINATIDLRPIDWGTWDERINLMIASSEEVDIIFTAQWNGHSVNVAKGAFLPLNELIHSHGQGIVETLHPAFLEGAAISGVNYAVPTNKELAAQYGVMVRPDIAEKYDMDLDSISSPYDLTPLLETIKENEPGMIPFYTQKGPGIGLMFMDYDNLGDYKAPGEVDIFGSGTPTVVNPYATPEFREGLDLMREWFLAGYVNADAATTTTTDTDQMRAGNVFMTWAPLKPGKDAEQEAALGLPQKQIELTAPIATTAETAGSMLGISRTSADPERAMMFINLLHTDPYINNLLNFGIEDVHYVKVSDNVIDYHPDIDPNSPRYFPGAAWMFGNQFLNYLWTNEDPDKWDKFRAFNDDATISPGLGMTFDSEPVRNEIAATFNVREEYYPALVTGSVDPESVLPDFLDKYEAAGAGKVIEEKQRQLDDFLSGN